MASKAVTLVTLLAMGSAYGQEKLPDDVPRMVRVAGGLIAAMDGTPLEVGTGYFVNEPGYQALAAELERLQVAEARLSAENQSLRVTPREETPSGGIWFVVLGVLTGAAIATGIAVAKG